MRVFNFVDSLNEKGVNKPYIGVFNIIVGIGLLIWIALNTVLPVSITSTYPLQFNIALICFVLGIMFVLHCTLEELFLSKFKFGEKAYKRTLFALFKAPHIISIVFVGIALSKDFDQFTYYKYVIMTSYAFYNFVVINNTGRLPFFEKDRIDKHVGHLCVALLLFIVSVIAMIEGWLKDIGGYTMYIVLVGLLVTLVINALGARASDKKRKAAEVELKNDLT